MLVPTLVSLYLDTPLSMANQPGKAPNDLNPTPQWGCHSNLIQADNSTSSQYSNKSYANNSNLPNVKGNDENLELFNFLHIPVKTSVYKK